MPCGLYQKNKIKNNIEAYGRFMVKKVISNISLLVLTILLFALAQPNIITTQGIPLAAYFMYLPMFLLINRVSWKTVWLYGLLCGVGCYCLFTYWLASFHPMGISVISLLYGFQFLLLFPLLKLAGVSSKKGWILQWLILCAYEYVKTIGFAGFHYGLTAYSHWRCTTIIQCADIVGVWGINALITFPSAWLSSFFKPAFLENSPDFKKLNFKSFIKNSFIPITIWICFFISAIVYGITVQKDYSDYDTKTVALIQTNTDPWIGGDQAFTRDLESLIRLSDDALIKNPKIDFVVWPETAFVPRIEWHYKHRYNQDRFSLVNNLLLYLDNVSVPFVIGNDYGIDGYTRSGIYDVVDYNAVLLFKPGENVIPPHPEKYLKMHLVPFTEHFPYEKYFPKLYELLLNGDTHMWEPGLSADVFTINGFKFASPVCFEDTFGYIGRLFVQEGAQAFVNLSNDAWSKSLACQYQHLSMAVFRSIENRVPSVRATASGQTCIIDPNGKITNMAEPFTETYLVGTIPVVHTKKQTVYTQYGDIVGILFVIISGVLFCVVLIRKMLQYHAKKEN